MITWCCSQTYHSISLLLPLEAHDFDIWKHMLELNLQLHHVANLLDHVEAELEALQAQGHGFPDPSCWTILAHAEIKNY